MPAARHVDTGDTIIQALHFASSILLVALPKANQSDLPQYECRGCITLAVDSTRTAKLVGVRMTLEHLDEHLRVCDAGAKDAIWKMEACAGCRGAGRLTPPLGTPTVCAECKGDGKNASGKDRGVRRGVVVG